MFSSAITISRSPVTASTTSATFSPKTLAKPPNKITLLTSKPHEGPITTTTAMSSSSLLLPSKPNPHTTRYSSASATTTTNVTLKSRLAAGETLYGLFLLSFSPTLAEIAGLAGYDYVVIDMEHGHGGISDALPCIRALAATGTAAILRLPESSAVWAKKALDVGPQGIMFPMIENARSAADVVSFCRYPPKGVRGAAHPVVRASGYGIDDGYLENYESELLVMVQVETGKAVGEIEAIAAVEGVDCVQMGPLDLSGSLGYLWKPGHRKVRAVLEEGEKKVLEGGGKGKAYLGGFAVPHDPAVELKKRGYHMVSGAVDVGIFRQAVVDDVVRFRKAPGVGAGDEGSQKDGGEEEDKGYWSE